MKDIEIIKVLTDQITMSVFGTEFKLRVEHDNQNPEGRIFIQVVYDAPCTKTGDIISWHGRKWYISEFMTDDEVVKTCYAAFEAAVKHEIMEGFKINGIILFNPHVSYRWLLSISDKEVKRGAAS